MSGFQPSTLPPGASMASMNPNLKQVSGGGPVAQDNGKAAIMRRLNSKKKPASKSPADAEDLKDGGADEATEDAAGNQKPKAKGGIPPQFLPGYKKK